MDIKKIIGTSSWLDLVKHLSIILIISLGSVLYFFYIYLPEKTNRGESITVPDVIGVSYDQLNFFLVTRNLRYEVIEDSGYSEDYPPLSVLKQFPLPNAKVKENRKIYVTLNKTTPPLIKMPDLLDGSLINAQNILQTYNLKIGRIEYKPALYFNTVLKQMFNGREVFPSEKIPKGSAIDLELADGYGEQELSSPMLIGLDEEKAKVAIIGSGLKVGKIKYENTNRSVFFTKRDTSKVAYYEFIGPGEVVKQAPKPRIQMKLQQSVDIWIYQPDSLNNNKSILDL